MFPKPIDKREKQIPFSFSIPSTPVYRFQVVNVLFGINDKEVPTCGIYLKTFLNLFSTLGLVPFSIIYIQSSGDCDGVYDLREKCILQKILAVINYLGGCAMLLYSIYDSVIDNTTWDDPTLILTMTSFSMDLCMSFHVWSLLYFRRNLIILTVNSLRGFRYPLNRWKVKACFLAVLLICSCIVVGICSPYQNRQLGKVTEIMLNSATDVLQYLTYNPKTSPYHSTLKFLLYWWLFWCSRLLRMTDCFLFVVAYTVTNVADNFTLRIQSTQSIDLVMSEVQELQTFSENLNRSLGYIYVNFFITTLCYYAGTPANLRRSANTKTHWYKGIYVFMTWMTWAWSCEFYRKVQVSLRRWIREYKNCRKLTQMDIGKMNLLAMEIEHDAIGITCRFFTVNYSLVFSLLGLLVTYSILAFQV